MDDNYIMSAPKAWASVIAPQVTKTKRRTL